MHRHGPADWPDLDLGELLRPLVSRGVDFVVVGGIAAIAQGSPRLTQDLDIAYATDKTNLEALGDVLVGLGARLWGVDEDVPFVPDARTLRKVDLLTLETDSGRIDVMARPAGAPAYDRLRQGAERMDIAGVAVLVASVEDLLRMKRASDRPKDRADVAELEAIQRLRSEDADRS